MLQEQLDLFKLRKLNGVEKEVEKPTFMMDNYRSGDFQRQTETYLQQHFGFREPVVRLYNQYLWDFYKKTFAHDVIPGKDGWLYYVQSVNDFYGTEIYRWVDPVEEAEQDFDREVRNMNRLRAILKEYGVDFMVFMAPEKGFLYSEHLPDREHDTTYPNARLYYAEKLKETDFPFIEMTSWFQQMKDTASFPLIPPTAAHWNFSSVVAADSLFRFMEDLKGIEMPQIQLSNWKFGKEAPYRTADHDLEHLLNLQRRIYSREPRGAEADIQIVKTEKAVKPKVLFIGNSFLWRMNYYVPLEEIFSKVEFWYYYSTAFYGPDLTQQYKVKDGHILEKILDFDYVVWFTTGNQMYKATSGFVEDALLALCMDEDSLFRQIINVADTLALRADVQEKFAEFSSDSVEYRHELMSFARNHFVWDIELLKEFQGENVPASRNPKLPYALTAGRIREDSVWTAALKQQASLRAMSFEKVLYAEAKNVVEGGALLKDQVLELDFAAFYPQEVARFKQLILIDPEWLLKVKASARIRHQDLEEALQENARWAVRKRYGLMHLGLQNHLTVSDTLAPFFKWKIESIEEQMKSDSNWMVAIENKALANGKSIEQALHDDAVWLMEKKYKMGSYPLSKH